MGRIAKAIKIAHCRPRYHLTGVPGVPPLVAGDLDCCFSSCFLGPSCAQLDTYRVDHAYVGSDNCACTARAPRDRRNTTYGRLLHVVSRWSDLIELRAGDSGRASRRTRSDSRGDVERRLYRRECVADDGCRFYRTGGFS